jgi:hypothetical protein
MKMASEYFSFRPKLYETHKDHTKECLVADLMAGFILLKAHMTC